MKCISCGMTISDDEKECSFCGTVQNSLKDNLELEKTRAISKKELSEIIDDINPKDDESKYVEEYKAPSKPTNKVKSLKVATLSSIVLFLSCFLLVILVSVQNSKDQEFLGSIDASMKITLESQLTDELATKSRIFLCCSRYKI